MPHGPPEHAALRRSPLRQVAKAALAALLPGRLFLVRGSPTEPNVYLTFDDGPHPEHTPRLLDQLAQYQIPATFFLIGREAERHPHLVRRIVDQGHQIGNHTWSHDPPHQVSARKLTEEIQRTQTLLADLTGQTPRLFRPPLGKLTVAKLWRVWRLGLTVALWSRDPKDYEAASLSDLQVRLGRLELQAGDIILMHDNRPYAADAVSQLAAAADARLLRFSPLRPS